MPYLYAEGSEFYEPFSNERIVEIALGGCGAKDDANKKNEEELKGKEDIQLLLNLGFNKSDFEVQHRMEQGREEEGAEEEEGGKAERSKSIQLFILASISRLADYYANLEHMKPKVENSNMNIENVRKPYCVSLLPKVFEYLKEFLDFYSKKLFAGKGEEGGVHLEQCSLLCTLRIIKYNLANAEGLSKYLKKMDVSLPNKEFTKKLRELVHECLERFGEINGSEEIGKAIYQEMLGILRHNLSFIFDDNMEMILAELQKNLERISKIYVC